MAKPKLLICSDMFGFKYSNFICHYESILKQRFAIELIDMRQFIQEDSLDEKAIHNAFVSYGITQAVKAFHNQYLDSYNILAFSIGGTIAWKACLNGLKAKTLTCISSTRLRYESQVPQYARIKLYFGEKDNFIPQKTWSLREMVSIETIQDCGHEMYKDEKVIKKICNAFLKEI